MSSSPKTWPKKPWRTAARVRQGQRRSRGGRSQRLAERAVLVAGKEERRATMSRCKPFSIRPRDNNKRLEKFVRRAARAAWRSQHARFRPAFLHSTGQLHKGGPNSALVLQIVDQPSENLPVPETNYTFDALIQAQALGRLRRAQAAAPADPASKLGARHGKRLARLG